MARLLYTIWALILNSLGMPIFQTCFMDLTEDEYGEPLLSSSLIASFLVATGVYVIVVNGTIFPESFRKPKPSFMFLYEFLVTAFFMEFVIDCIWTPIDVLVRITLPKNLCYVM
ncbi:uncharacterized protein LOC116845488 [Odontomachus brunneus]|uniref:uncharacterized protein LOC116845488 n=1 Tax=Odontomachus brunneus TaxID=486640 RepID=UPI0013F29EBE|nr:uncharacterized protein LOC116845488 [Odontomachus brunneus]